MSETAAASCATSVEACMVPTAVVVRVSVYECASVCVTCTI